MTSNTIVRLPEVKTITGLSKSTIYAAAKRGDFPSPISLGADLLPSSHTI